MGLRDLLPATPAPAPVHADRLINAMANIDWVQFTMNGGGCFHLDPDGSLCGRAIRWAGHQSEDTDHLFVPLHVAATQLARSAPAPVRISPEVRETILQALDELKDKYHEVEIDDAIEFVEALPRG